MDPPPAERLTVRVNLMSEPCLWCWEIVDAKSGTLIESSWAAEWAGYASSHEAWSAGILRLNKLSWRSRTALL